LKDRLPLRFTNEARQRVAPPKARRGPEHCSGPLSLRSVPTFVDSTDALVLTGLYAGLEARALSPWETPLNEQTADAASAALEADDTAAEGDLGDGEKTKGANWIDPEIDP
jgi:hypothetical protein